MIIGRIPVPGAVAAKVWGGAAVHVVPEDSIGVMRLGWWYGGGRASGKQPPQLSGQHALTCGRT